MLKVIIGVGVALLAAAGYALVRHEQALKASGEADAAKSAADAKARTAKAATEAGNKAVSPAGGGGGLLDFADRSSDKMTAFFKRYPTCKAPFNALPDEPRPNPIGMALPSYKSIARAAIENADPVALVHVAELLEVGSPPVAPALAKCLRTYATDLGTDKPSTGGFGDRRRKAAHWTR